MTDEVLTLDCGCVLAGPKKQPQEHCAEGRRLFDEVFEANREVVRLEKITPNRQMTTRMLERGLNFAEHRQRRAHRAFRDHLRLTRAEFVAWEEQ